VHRQFHRRPRVPTISREGANELRIFAVLIDDGATHGETPKHILVRRFEQNRVGVGELNRTLPSVVVEDGHWLGPCVAIVLGNACEDITHVLFAVGHRTKRHHQMLPLPLRNEGLPQPPCIRV